MRENKQLKYIFIIIMTENNTIYNIYSIRTYNNDNLIFYNFTKRKKISDILSSYKTRYKRYKNNKDNWLNIFYLLEQDKTYIKIEEQLLNSNDEIVKSLLCDYIAKNECINKLNIDEIKKLCNKETEKENQIVLYEEPKKEIKLIEEPKKEEIKLIEEPKKEEIKTINNFKKEEKEEIKTINDFKKEEKEIKEEIKLIEEPKKEIKEEIIKTINEIKKEKEIKEEIKLIEEPKEEIKEEEEINKYYSSENETDNDSDNDSDDDSDDDELNNYIKKIKKNNTIKLKILNNNKNKTLKNN